MKRSEMVEIITNKLLESFANNNYPVDYKLVAVSLLATIEGAGMLPPKRFLTEDENGPCGEEPSSPAYWGLMGWESEVAILPGGVE